MGCYECGGDGGDSLRLCQACIDRKNSARDARLKGFHSTMAERDVLDKLSTSLPLQAAMAGVIIVVMFAYFLFFGPVKQLGVGASMIFAGMVTGASASALTYLLFWVNMLLIEPMWAIGALIIPGLAYRFVYLRWDQAKLPFLLHLASSAAMLFLCVLFARTQSMSVTETVLLLQSHTHGEKARIGDSKKVEFDDPEKNRAANMLRSILKGPSRNASPDSGEMEFLDEDELPPEFAETMKKLAEEMQKAGARSADQK